MNSIYVLIKLHLDFIESCYVRKVMHSKNNNSSSSKKYAFFESPLDNLERKTESEQTMKEPPISYDPRFVFPESFVSPYPFVDNVSMDSNFLCFEHLKPGERMQNTILIRRPPIRDFKNEMRLVEHYMTLNNGS